MNPNNYFDKTINEFLDMLNGEIPFFFNPHRAVPLMSHQTTNQAREASGLDPIRKLYIPSFDERQKGWRILMHTNKGINPEEPIIYRVKDSMRWYRGMNTDTGEAVKPEIGYDIDLLGCEFLGGLTIHEVRSKKTMNLSACQFLPTLDNQRNEGLIIHSSKFDELSINNGFYTSTPDQPEIRLLKIVDLQAEKLSLSGLRIKELYITGDKGHIKELSISKCEIGAISIHGTVFDRVSFYCNRVEYRFNFSSITNIFFLNGYDFIENKAFSIETLDIKFYNQLSKAEYSLERADIHHFQLHGNTNSSLVATDCSVCVLKFEYFVNTGYMRLHNIHSISRLEIIDSVMGKTVLSNFDWSDYANAMVAGALLTDMVLVNTVFPKKLQGRTDKDYKQVHSTLRQLKYIASQTGDRIQELSYEARELNAYFNVKQTPKNWTDRIIYIGDKLILWANWITNNHGQSWLQALGVLILFTAFTFTAIKYTLGYSLVLGTFSSTDFSDYLEFAVNPLHEFEKLFKIGKDVSSQTIGTAKIWDFASKLFGGIILFQLVRAFRKYSRSDAA